MANKNNKLDDFDFDDLNFDMPELDSEDNRSKKTDGPIRKMSRSFGEGARDAIVDPQVIRRFASAALPDGYGTALNTASDIGDGAAELYNIAAKELRPLMPSMRRAAGRLAEKSFLPKGVQERLRDMSKSPEELRRQSQEDSDNAAIAHELGGIFAANMQQQAEHHAKDTVERKIRERVTEKMSLSSLRQLDSIRGGIDRLAAYQDQVTIKFQQKSLELQYRQLFATREILSLHKANTVRDYEFMQAMLKNTSMSDGAKAAAELKDDRRLVNRMKHQFQQSIVRHFGSFGKQIQESLANSLKSALGGFAEAFSMVSDVQDTIGDAQEMGADVSLSSEISRMVGRGAMEKVMNFAAAPIRRKLGKNKKLTGFGARLNYLFQNLPEHITSWASTSTNGDSLFSDFINIFKEMIPRKGLDNSFGESPIYSADEPAAFNMQTRRSITEVIPGFLSRIHHELLKIRTNDPNVEAVSYNMVRGAFSSSSDAAKDTMRQVFNPRMITHARSGVDDFIKEYIDPDGKLEPKTIQALKRQLFMDTVKGELFKPERFTSNQSDMAELKGDDRDAVAELIRQRYQTGDRDDDSIAINASNTKFVGLRNLIPDVKNAMMGWRDVGQKDILLKEGLINSLHGVDTVNMSRVMQMILNDAEGESKAAQDERRDARDAMKSRVDKTLDRVTDAIKDVYANGSDSPVIQAAKLRAEEYRDMSTGAVIKTIDDIRGPVEDREGNIVVTVEQAIEGLRTRGGKILKRAQAGARLFKRRHRDKINRANGMIDSIRNGVKSAPDMAREGYKSAKDKAKKIYSIYEEGGTTALIDAASLEAGHYQDMLTGKVLETVDDIKGPVMDLRNHRQVLRAEHFAKGLRSEYGEKLTKLTSQVKTNASDMYKTHIAPRLEAIDPMNRKAGMSAPADAGVNMAGEISTLVQLNAQQVELLTGIHEILVTRNFMVAPGQGGPEEEEQRQSWMQRIKNMPRNIKGMVTKARTKAWGAVTWSASKIRTGAWGLIKKAGSMYGTYVKGTLGFLGKAVAAPFKLASGLFGGGADALTDIWVQGGKTPALYAKKMRNGDYFDQATGKVIKTIKDIQGAVIEVVDGAPQVVLTAEEYASGLYDSRGRKLASKLFNAASGLLGAVFGGYASIAKLPFVLMKGVADLVTSGVRRSFRQPDVYVKSDLKTPRLRGILLEQGKYWSVKSEKIVYKIDDLDGAIREVDGEKRELISEEEFNDGLVNWRGKELGTIAGKIGGALAGAAGFAARAVGGLARGYAKVVGGALGMGRDALVGIFGKIGGIFNPKVYTTTTKKTNDLLEAIHDLIDARMPDNGTGRAGSWQSQLKARREALKNRKDKDAEARTKDDGEGGFLRGLLGKGKAGLLGMLGLGGDEEGEDDGDTTVIAGGLGGDGDGEDGKDKKGKRNRRPKGKLGKLKALGSSGWNKVKGLGGKLKGKIPKGKLGILASLLGAVGLSQAGDMMGGKVGGALETASTVHMGVQGASWLARLAGMGSLAGGGAAAGSAATATAGAGALATGATGAGTAVAGGALATIGLPLLLGAAVVGAVGYGIYKGYKKYKYGTFTPLRAFRMAQYGISYTNADHVEKMVEFEQMVEPHVRGIGGKVDIYADGMSMEDVYKHFDIDDGWFSDNSNERKQFDLWFNQRFKPVFVAWRNATNGIKAGMALNEADDTLKTEQKTAVLKAVNGMNKAVYTVMVTPFGETEIGPKEVTDLYTRANHAIETDGKGGLKSLRSKVERLGLSIMKSGLVPGGAIGASLLEKYYAKRDQADADASAKKKGELEKKSGIKLGVMGGGMLKGVRLGGSVSALDAVRYRTYGLTDMDTDKVRALASLESDAAHYIRFDQDGRGRFDGDVDALFQGYAPMFNINGNKRDDWVEWFEKRFLPTLIQFGAAVRRFNTSGSFLEASKTLKPDQQLEVAQETQGAKRTVLLMKFAVWGVTVSPWTDYPLNTDPRTVHDNLTALKEAVKKRTLSEDKGKAAGGKGAKGTASTTGAEAANRRQQQTGIASRMKEWLLGSKGKPTALGAAVTATGALAAGTYEQATRTASSVYQGVRDGLGFGPEIGPPPQIKGSAKQREQMLLKEAIKAGITDPAELAMLLAQVAHETGNFKQLFESMKYRPDRAKAVFPRRFRDAQHAKQVLAQGDAAFAEAIYGGRKDLGNNQPGDGYRFRGRGLMQLTGRYNYSQFAKWSGIDVVTNPDLVATDPRVAALSAVYYWTKRVRGKVPVTNLLQVTRAINGGENGLDHRRQLFGQYLQMVKGKTSGALATTTTANGPEGGLGGKTNNVVMAADFSGVSSSTSTTSDSASTAKAGARPARTDRSAAMLAAAPGYGSSLDAAASRSIAPTYGSTPTSNQDDVIAQQRKQAAASAAANDMRAQMANDDAIRQLSTVTGLLNQQLNTQKSMDAKLGDIASVLKTMKGSALAAAEPPPTDVAGKTKTAGATQRSVRANEQMPQAPISVRRRSVG